MFIVILFVIIAIGFIFCCGSAEEPTINPNRKDYIRKRLPYDPNDPFIRECGPLCMYYNIKKAANAGYDTTRICYCEFLGACVEMIDRCNCFVDIDEKY